MLFVPTKLMGTLMFIVKAAVSDLLVQILSILCSFRQMVCQIIGSRIPSGIRGGEPGRMQV